MRKVILFVCVAFILLPCDDSKAVGTHIIGIPGTGISNSFVYVKIGRELVKRGYKYTLVVPTWQQQELKETGAYLGWLQVKSYVSAISGRDLEKLILKEVEGRLGIAERIEFWRSACESLLQHSELLNSLREVDLVVCEITSICCAIVADLLKVNRVDLTPSGFIDPYLSFIHNFPSPVAYVPHGTVKLPKRLKFLHRVQNVMLYILGYVMHKFAFIPPFEDLWRSYAKDSKFTSLEEVFRATGLLLIPNDFALDFPRPFGAHVKIVGPILPDPPKQLPLKTECFITQGNFKELVLVSLGTVISNFTSHFVDTIAEGLAKVPAKVIWKHKGKQPQYVSENVMIVPWMRQNDLLGFSYTKVFLTHGGLNSILESAYHGTPMVVLPLFGDQPANAMKVFEAGMGVILEAQDLTPVQITDVITEVLTNPKYKENAMKVSKLMRHRRISPTEEACDWIEYGLRNNAGLHLRSEGDNLSFIQLYLLDVLFVMIVVLFGLAALLYFTLKYCFVGVAQILFKKTKAE
ncbi:unnamed protein product [Porites lobata]|uniref:UDP-glucuronosyltransferase n=1 Tax=Porites lobata TaxID=104759 RepID=A0ABN8NC73_9CNID|nr:unnamed protein product [Porites lobata]